MAEAHSEGASVDANRCEQCGTPMPSGVLQAVCPLCVLNQIKLTGFSGASGAAPFDPLTATELSELLPNFEVDAIIGRGGMGVVYKARQKNLDRQVAIKLLPVEVAVDPEFEDRFMLEAKTMAKLDHPNVAHIYDFGEVEGQYYIVMEYVEGHHLAHRLLGDSVSTSEAFNLMYQVLEGLEYAHSRGVIHRDIKPANIIITPDGRVKVMDFGLAKLVDTGDDVTAITRTNATLGTPHYMAPEQHKDSGVADARSDIYALGVVLYELLTGVLPIGNFPPPSDKAPVTTKLDEVVLKALESDADRRFQTVREFKEQLQMAIGEAVGEASEKQTVVLLFTDVVDSVGLTARVGPELFVEYIERHDFLIKEALQEVTGARVLQHTGDGFLIRLGAPSDAVRLALKIQCLLGHESWPDEPLVVRIGLHLGEVIEITEQNTGVTKPVGFAINLASRVMSLAQGGQILMTRVVFDDARQYVKQHPAVPHVRDVENLPLQWPAHGRYLFQGSDEPMEIFEVGIPGVAPLTPPPDTGKAKRAVAADEEQTLGWRPGVGLDIPRRPNWSLLKKIGEGGFGEVWLAEHRHTKDQRVFKFCFDAMRLRSFKRELTLFRLFRDALGKRSDIATIHEVQVESPPFYLESDYLPGGNLAQWIEMKGGIEKLTLEARVTLVAKIARAVGAAHSVGIIHKDIKPSNIRTPDLGGKLIGYRFEDQP